MNAHLQQLIDAVGNLNEITLFVIFILGLVYAFGGYILFRIELVINGLMVGTLLGIVLLAAFRPVPTGMDFFVAALAGAVLGALASWFLYRLIFALLAGGSVTLCIVAIFGNPYSVGVWILAGLAGLGVAILSCIYTRQIVIFLFGLWGGATAVASSAAIMAGGPDKLIDKLIGSQRQVWLAVLLAVLVLTVSAGGMYTQVVIARKFRSSLAPKPKAKPKKRSPKRRASHA